MNPSLNQQSIVWLEKTIDSEKPEKIGCTSRARLDVWNLNLFGMFSGVLIYRFKDESWGMSTVTATCMDGHGWK